MADKDTKQVQHIAGVQLTLVPGSQLILKQ